MRKLRLLFVSFLSMLAWNGAFAQDVDLQAAYEAALATIQDGGTYRVFSEVGGTKYYLNTSGHLVDNTKGAATFTFKKVGGDAYEFGFNLADSYFTNPELNNNEAVLNSGHINTNSSARNNWEAQVFFLQDGKYAIRATNAPGGDSSWNLVAKTFWVVNEGENGPVAEYTFDAPFIWQIEEYVDPRPEAFNMVSKWIDKLQAVEGLVTNASQWSSNAKEPSEGSFEALTDGDYNTFFHSMWSGSGPDEDHYLQAELPEAVEKFYFFFKKRSQNNNDRVTVLNILASNDGENFTEIASINEGLPTDAAVISYASEAIDLGTAYKYIRFSIADVNAYNNVNNGHHWFTFSEFYLLPSNAVTDVAMSSLVNDYTQIEEENLESIKLIDGMISDLVKQKELENEVAVLRDATNELKELINSNDYLTSAQATDAATAASAVVSEVDMKIYTSAEDIEADKVRIQEAKKAFLAAITPVRPLDVTDEYIVNPNPVANLDGWEGTQSNAYDAGNNVAEYWNISAANFHQVVNLPAGTYKLTAIALTRPDMESVIYAGTKSVNIVAVENTIVNNRAQANSWFNEGNGVNELEFTLENDSLIEIGLTADANVGDHWTVWRSFVLQRIPSKVYTSDVVFNIKDAEGKIVATKTQALPLDTEVNIVPEELQRGYCTYEFTPIKVEKAETVYTIDATFTYTEPFPAGKDMNILVKDGHQFLTVNEDGTLGFEPYDENLELQDKYIWTITGTPYGYQIKDKLGNYISGKTITFDNEGLEVAIASEEAATVCLVEYLWGFGIAVEDGHEIYGIDNHFRHHGHFNGSYFIAKIAGQKDVELADNRMATQGYAAQQGSIDVEAACEYLGVESLSEAKLFIVNPDGTEIADYAPFDGWFNGEGVATTWGENTKVCVKFFQVLNDGKYEICDMNGADQVGATYTVRWKLQAENGKSILYTINVNFTEYVEPVYQPEIVKTIDIAHQELAATPYNEAEAAPTFDVAEVCEALGISSIAEAKAYIVNVTNGNFVENTTDGWRNAEGDAANWGSGEGMFCLKLNDPSTGAFDYTGAIDDTFKAGDTFVAQWGIVANEKAVLLKVTVTFVEAISEGNATAISNINLAEKAEMFDLSGRRVSKAQKGIYVINGQKVAVK